MDSRKGFEKWFDDKWKKKLEGFPRLERIRLRNIAKAAWQDSRAAIEIDLDINTVGIHARYVNKDEVIRLLRDAGLTVKGE